MTKKSILKVTIASAAVLVTAAVFCGAYYNGGNASNSCPNCGAPDCPEGTTCTVCMNDNFPNVIGKTKHCTHPIDQEYTEPTVKPGKYYLNGDVNSCYLEVTENTWQLIPTDDCSIEKLYGEQNKWSDEAPADPATAPDANPELTESRIQYKEEDIAFFSQPHDYTVVTWHVFDTTWLCPGPGGTFPDGMELSPQVYYQNGVAHPGPVLENENTISIYGGDYILVE